MDASTNGPSCLINNRQLLNRNTVFAEILMPFKNREL